MVLAYKALPSRRCSLLEAVKRCMATPAYTNRPPTQQHSILLHAYNVYHTTTLRPFVFSVLPSVETGTGVSSALSDL